MRLPSFSESAYKIAGYVATGCVTLSGLFFCYHLIFTSGWTISAEWNMFKSWLFWPLFIIGFIYALTNLGKTHYSQDTIIETERRDGTWKREKSNDITDVMFGHFFVPLLGHFVLEPLMIAAVIYYPLMCVVALVGKLVPYILAVLVLAACFGTFKFTSIVGNAKGSVAIVALALLLTGGFGYGGYAIYSSNAPQGAVDDFPTEPVAGDSTVVATQDDDYEAQDEFYEDVVDTVVTTTTDSAAVSGDEEFE